MTTTQPVTTWVPGDPLYNRAPYSQYIFNFRDDHEDNPEPGTDAAHWPHPRGRTLGDLPPECDELGLFIRDHRAWAARAFVREQLLARIPWLVLE